MAPSASDEREVATVVATKRNEPRVSLVDMLTLWTVIAAVSLPHLLAPGALQGLVLGSSGHTQDTLIAFALIAWAVGGLFAMWQDHGDFCEEGKSQEADAHEDEDTMDNVEDSCQKCHSSWLLPLSPTMAFSCCLVLDVMVGLALTAKDSLQAFLTPIVFEMVFYVLNSSDMAVIILVAAWAILGLVASHTDLQNFKAEEWNRNADKHIKIN